jgi:hypothetical protein
MNDLQIIQRLRKSLVNLFLSLSFLTLVGFFIPPERVRFKDPYEHYEHCWKCGGYILPPWEKFLNETHTLACTTPVNTSWEDGDRTDGGNIIFNSALDCTPECMQISDSFARLGDFSIRSPVFASSPCTCGNSIRCEGAQKKVGADTLVNSPYYAISLYPRLYYSPLDNQNELSLQWKTTSTSPQDPQPVLALWERKVGLTTHWRLVLNVDSVNPNQSAYKTWEYDLGVLVSDAWTDWLFIIDWQDNYLGRITVYQNGVPLTGITKVQGPTGGSTDGTTIFGPNTNRFYNQILRGYDPMRIGLYKFPYCQSPGTINTVQKVIYYDVWKIGNNDCDTSEFIISPAPPPSYMPRGVRSGNKKPAQKPVFL